MTKEKGKSKMTGIGKFLKADTTSSLKSLMTHRTAASSRSVEQSQEVQSSGQESRVNEASLAQVESNMASFSVYGGLPLASENTTFTFELTAAEMASLLDEKDLTGQKQLIKDIVRELHGIELKEVYAYKVNDRLCIEEDPEAIAQQLDIPRQMLAGLKDVGSLYHGPTATGDEITVKRIALQEALKELAEHLLPSVWQLLKELQSYLFGIDIQSRAVYAYRVNNELRIVESPQAMAQSLGLPETELASLQDMDEQYHGRDIQDQQITVKRVALYDAVTQLTELLLSQEELIKDLVAASDTFPATSQLRL